MIFIYIILGIICGGFGLYFILRPKLFNIKQINTEVEKENHQLLIDNQKFVEQNKELQLVEFQLQTKIEAASDSLKKLTASAEEAAEAMYQTSLALASEKMDNAATRLREEYNEASEMAKQEYSDILKELAENTYEKIQNYSNQISQLKIILDEMRAKADAAINAAKAEEEKELQIEKYKIGITEADLLEINRLREIAPYFRNSRNIYKIIWEGYYRNSTNDLINRILGTTTTSGIYRITNLKNKKTYIGQSVDLSARLKEHIKAGLGIDTPSNKLYIAMFKDGVENFTFEIIEKCDKTQLNEREMYWIAFYRSQEHGYNMTKGNK